MPTKNFPADTLEQATTVLTACKQIDSDLKLGTITQKDFGDTIAHVQAMQTQINQLEIQLLNLRNRRDDQIAGTWETVKRVRATVKGMYGDDSSEYEMVGGTRMSERKKSIRKQAA
jgi:hypothetical protein